MLSANAQYRAPHMSPSTNCWRNTSMTTLLCSVAEVGASHRLVVRQSGGGALGDDSARVDENRGRADLEGEVRVLFDHEDRGLGLLADPAERTENLLRDARGQAEG